MGDPEEATRLSILNATPTKLPGPSLLHDLIGNAANQNSPAIDFLGEDGKRLIISYHDFEILSDRLADRISRALYALPTTNATDKFIVPLMIPQSPDLYITLYAILKSGAAFCPLNLDAPSDRIKFILKDIKADLILTTTTLAQRISATELEAKLICVDQEDSTAAVTVEHRTNHDISKEKVTTHDLAYVMYTSGSTGAPKGVGIPHGAAVQSLLAHDKHIPPFLRFLQFAAPTFDVSVFEIFFPLFRGNTLICCNRADLLTDLPGIIRKMEVDACELTPSVAGSLLRSRNAAPCLRLVLTIGEMLTEPVVNEFGGDVQTPSILWGMYGPTEATIHCTLQPAFEKNASTQCIGIPFDTVSAFVVKYTPDIANGRTFEVVPIGEVGELAIGGYQLAAGYLNRPEQTAASFVQTDFGRVYRTGDKARMLPNGTIECLGRVAEGQIKLNGQRMELGEVEHAILRTKGCHGAYVCAISNVLVAFVAVEDIAGMRDNIKTHCKEWLPAYMVPSEIVVMKDFPRLPSGKIDRMRLKEEYSSLATHDEHFDNELHSLDATQRTLCSIIGDLLQTQVQMSTRLSAIGMDSLSAIRLATRLRERSIFLTPLDILDSVTLQDLYRRVQHHEKEPVNNEMSSNGHCEPNQPGQPDLMERLAQDPRGLIDLNSVEAATQCTSLQISMLVETLKDPKLYINTVDIKLPPNLSTSIVESWFLELAEKNEILRSGFVHLDDQTIQVIWRRLPSSQLLIVDEFSTDEFPDIDTFLAHPFQVQVHSSLLRARLTIHHAIYDGWTIDLLLDDMNNLAHGKNISIRPQFREITRFLDSDSESVQSESAKEFWAEHLRGIGGASLPNFKTTAVLDTVIESEKMSLDVKSHEILQVARESGVTPQAIFQASLVWLWGTIIGSDDVTIGSVFSGRTLPVPGIERVMGPCLSTLPIRTKLDESRTILDLVRSLHLINRQIMHLKPIKLADVKKAASIPQGSNLFDLLFVYQESLSSRSRDKEAISEISHKDHIETKLLLEVEPYGGGYSSIWTFHSDSFSSQHVQAFAEHFSHLCSYFCRQIRASLASVRSSFSSRSLSTYTTGFKPLETCSSLAALIEERSALTPSKEALCFAESMLSNHVQVESLTYQQLNEKANQIARLLLASGVTPGGIVAIIMEKSPLLYCGILGILKAGCAYLPLLPTTPQKRVASILEQSRPEACIVDDAVLSNDSQFLCPLLRLHDQRYTQFSTTNLDISHDPAQLAYIIFTSGTTGTPKGVSVTNKNMLSNIKALSKIYPLEENSRMLQACSQAFDVSVFEIFFAWATGMCLCAATNDTLFDNLEEAIRQFQVTHLSMTVTVASLVNPRNVPNVKFLVTSGEAMTDEVLRKWERVLYQGYGPSETTNICTVRKVFPGDSSQFLGWSLENTSSFVFYPDSNELVPAGGIGELCFGGDQVAAGYLNMSELTASKFFNYPPYGRLYRSGDRGRMLPDGSLIILGRLDTQIKLRGQRIELREIQTIVLGSTMAKACASVVLERENAKTQQLVLFYVPSAEEKQHFEFLHITAHRRAEIQLLFQALEDTLPRYMIPSFILPIACLPLTSSGKTDTEHLRQTTTYLASDILDQCSRSSDNDEKLTEWTETERHVLDTLVAVLDVEKSTINRWTSFATLGLDSVSAMPFARRLSTTFSQKVPISKVLQNPSIGRLAQAIAPESRDPASGLNTLQQKAKLLPDELIELVKERLENHTRISEAIMPCTPLQASMLVSTMSSSNQSSYCNQMLFRVHCSLEEIIEAWSQVYLRHGILRTCFMSTNDIKYPLVQIVLKADTLPWSKLQVSSVEEGATQHLQGLVQPVDSFEPPFSLAILTTDDQQNYLSFVCHHALYDGVAVGKLLSEVEKLVHGETLQQPPSFQHFLQEALVLPTDTNVFWSKYFEGYHPKPLPQWPTLNKEVNGVDGVNGIKETNRANGFRATIDVKRHQTGTASCTLPLSSLQARLRSIGVSLLSLCQAAWFETLSVVTKSPDVCFGNVFSGRLVSVEGIDNLVAPCFNTIPMRLVLGGSKSNREVMRECQKLNAKMLQYQFTPLREIRSQLLIDDTRLFDSLLLLQPPANPLDESVWTLVRDAGAMDIPIVCEILPCPERDELRILLHRDEHMVHQPVESLLQETFVHALETYSEFPSSQQDLIHRLPSHLQSQIDRLTSPKPLHDRRNSATPSEESWTTFEEQVRHVVAELANFPLHRVGKHTSIYRLGLDSISVLQVASLLRRHGLSVSPVDILEHPSCAGIASCVQPVDGNSSSRSPQYDLASFQASVREQVGNAKLIASLENILPCTPLQQGMLSQFLLSEGANYFNFVDWELDPNVDPQRLQAAWTALQKRHQILRTGFVSIRHSDTSFAMLIHDFESILTPIVSLKGQEASIFDIKSWRDDCIMNALRDLTLSPWQVVIIESDNSKSMHLGIHHALYDAFSLQEMMHELSQILKDLKLSPAPSVETASLSILRYITQTQVNAEEFWKKQTPSLVVNPFPTLTPLRVDEKTRIRSSRSVNVPLQHLREDAALAGVTIQSALQSTWTRILSSYQGDAAVTFGVVLSGRTAFELDKAVFPCITTLPVIALNTESNRELLQSMMDYNAVLRKQEHTPLTRIQRWAGVPDSPIFDTILVYQQRNTHEDAMPWHITSETATVDYPVSIEVEEMKSDELRISVDFRSDVLPAEHAEVLLAQFEATLIHLLQSPDSHADDMVFKHQWLYSITPPVHRTLPAKAKLLHQFVEMMADHTPDNLALEFVHELDGCVESQKWTYRKLDAFGNRVSNLLYKNGIRPGGIVAICFDKCPEAYFSILGILKAGCAFVALDPSAPSSRHQFILEDSDACALMIQKVNVPLVASTSFCNVLEIDIDGLESFPETQSFEHSVSPDDNCYCLYTSGTTGTPKGCLITHDNAVQAMLAFQVLFKGHWDSQSRCLQFASFHFDVSVLEQYWSWSVGIPVVSAPRDLILSDLIATISKLRITHIDLTPSLARLVHPDEVPSLCKGVFITGGEQLRQDILDVWGSKGVIYNAYGPTEATIGVTMYCRVPQNGRSSNIGKQFPNVGSYVLRPNSDVPVLRGGIGELCVSGKLVGKGYLNRTELTEERFPVLDGFGERVYRTGDLVRILHDGCFDFLGRADDQVKLRGQRLEIGEINHVIKTGVSQVLDVATLVTKHRDQDRDIMISFIVTDIGNNNKHDLIIASDTATLALSQKTQDACREKLPSYMVPTYVFCVPYIPLSANNKVQISVLKQLFDNTSPEDLRRLFSGSENGNAKLSITQPELARVIAHVLKVNEDDILLSTTIFELGVDSISVIELARQLRAAGFKGASPSVILQNPRLNSIGKILRENPSNSDNSEIFRIKQKISACYHRHLGAACRKFEVTQDDIEYIAPCTSLQEGMLTRAFSKEDHATYFNSFQIQLSPGASVDRLRQSWMNVVQRNAILRTGFLQTIEGYVQVAFKKALLQWRCLQLNEETFKAQMDQAYQEWTKSNEYQLSAPLEVDCVHVDGRLILEVRIFHGIYDARSFDLMLQHINAIYNGEEVKSGPSFLEALPYGPLCDYGSSKSFWRDMFSGHSFHSIKSVNLGPPCKDISVSQSFDTGGLESRRIKDGVTQQTIIQTAWMSALRQNLKFWPCIGVLVSGRSMLLNNVENTIGPLFNTLPFCIQGASVHDWESLLHATHYFNTTTLSFAHVPLRQIQKWCSNGQPLFDNLFSFAHEDTASADAYPTLWTNMNSKSVADYPIAFEGVATKSQQLKVTIVAQSHIFDELALKSLLIQFQKALDGIISDEGFVLLHDEDSKESRNNYVSIHDHAVHQQVQKSNFVWTAQSREVQREIAMLAGVPDDQVGEETTLFELGLDSIDVVKLVTRLRRIGVNLKASQLLKQPTIQGIISSTPSTKDTNGESSSLRQLEAESQKLKQHLQTSDIDLSDIDTILPPTPLQDSMIAEMIESNFRRYFNHDVLEIAAETDFQLLKSAIETVIQESPILRTNFVEISDPQLDCAYAQVIRKKIDLFQEATSVETLQGIDEVLEQARQRAVKTKGQRALIQFTPVWVAEQQYLLLSVAHALYDGASLELFHRDVRAAYANKHHERPSYKNILARILDSSSESAANFWSSFLHDASPTILPEIEVSSQDLTSGVCRLEASTRLPASEIKSFCKRQGITIQVLGQACWSAVLASLSQSLNVTFGVILAGRDTEEVQNLMFPTMNTVPITTVLHGTVTEYLRYMWENLTNVNEFQFFPLRKAQKISTTRGGPLFNTLFIMQSQTDAVSEKSPRVWRSVNSSSEVDYPVCVEIESNDHDMVWRVACDVHYISEKTTRTIIDQLDTVLRYLVQHEDEELIDFSNNQTVSVCSLPPFALSVNLDNMNTQFEGTSLGNGGEQRDNELQLIQALADISGVDVSAISSNQSIYHLGLDSISAIKVSSVLRKRGIVVSVRDVVKAATIRDIATKINKTLLDNDRNETSVSDSPDPLRALNIEEFIAKTRIPRASVERILPVLPMQAHMLSAWQNSGGDLYFYQFTYELVAESSPEMIHEAWRTLLLEVPLLRTHFAATNSSEIPFVQVIAKPNHEQRQHEESNEVMKPWSLQRNDTPFVSLRASQATGGVTKLQLKIHHALYDGMSLPQIVNRFAALCGKGQFAPQFDHSAWNNFVLAHYNEGKKERRRSFWKSYLGGITQSQGHNADTTRHARTAEFQPGALEGLTKLKSTTSEAGIGLQALFFAAYAKYLVASDENKHENPARHDVVFGIYLANRASFDDILRDAPCPTLSIVPLRVIFEEDEGLVDIAKRIHSDIAEISSFENASVGLWEVAEWTGVRIDSFVNFLSLPKQAGEYAVDGEVTLRNMTPTWPQEDTVHAQFQEGLAKPTDEWTLGNRVREVYMEAIDVEASVRGDSLDIGVFGPSSSLSRAQATDMIHCIVELLKEA